MAAFSFRKVSLKKKQNVFLKKHNKNYQEPQKLISYKVNKYIVTENIYFTIKFDNI